MREWFFKDVFPGEPGGLPPWDQHHWIEDGPDHKGVPFAHKVYDFPDLPAASKTASFPKGRSYATKKDSYRTEHTAVSEARNNTDQMPFVVRSDSENESELVFLSPEEEIAGPENQEDQGALPVLRRSNRKRKSVASYTEGDMSKGSGSKKQGCQIFWRAFGQFCYFL